MKQLLSQHFSQCVRVTFYPWPPPSPPRKIKLNFNIYSSGARTAIKIAAGYEFYTTRIKSFREYRHLYSAVASVIPWNQVRHDQNRGWGLRVKIPWCTPSPPPGITRGWLSSRCRAKRDESLRKSSVPPSFSLDDARDCDCYVGPRSRNV